MGGLRAALVASACCLLLSSGAEAFSLGGGLPLGLAGARGRAGITPLRSPRAPAVQQPTMQIWNWVPVAAERQQRDPARLSPLKQLPPNIVIREAYKKAEEPYQGFMERANPGNFGPDMKAIEQMARDIGGKTDGDIFQMRFIDQGWRSYVVAEDTNTGEVVGCAQLARIQVGGYVYLTEDLQIKNLYVQEEYRGIGIANHMVHSLLLRLKEKERAWAFIEADTGPFFFFFASGFVGINYSEAGKVFPGVLWAFLWPFHLQKLQCQNTVFMCAEGRGGADAKNRAG